MHSFQNTPSSTRTQSAKDNSPQYETRQLGHKRRIEFELRADSCYLTQTRDARGEARRLLREIRALPHSPSRIKPYPIHALQRLLRAYPDRKRLQWFLETCTFGARIQLDPNIELPDRLHPKEPRFSWAEKVGVYKAFLKWHRTNCLIGPLLERQGMTASMVFAVPKPVPGEFRGILNLSDKSVTGVSVNLCLTEEFKHVEYVAQCEIIEKMLAVGRDAWLWVKDLEDGYHNVPVHAADIDRLCIRFDKKLYAFQRLPMGLASSPHIFTEFMHFPLWAIANNEDLQKEPWSDTSLYYEVIDSREVDVTLFREGSDLTRIGDTPFYRMCLIDSYVDDIFSLHLDLDASWMQWDHSEIVLQAMNLKCKVAKGKPPNQINVLLGKEYDLCRQWVRFSDEKLARYLAFFRFVSTCEWIPERVLLSVIGKARHFASIYKPLSAFARGLEAFIPYKNRPWSHRQQKLGRGPAIRNDARLKSRIDLLIRSMIIANKVGVPFTYFTRLKQRRPDFRIVTDASMLIGAGGIASDGTYFQTKWSELDMHIEQREERDIQWRELIAIYGSLLSLEQRHGDKLNDTLIEVFTDNIACKFMLINMTSLLARPDLQILINDICELCVRRRVHLWMEHIPGDDNKVADALSRFFENPLQYEQKHEYDVGPLKTDTSKQVSRIIQRGATRSADHVKESNITIERKFQEFPKGFE